MPSDKTGDDAILDEIVGVPGDITRAERPNDLGRVRSLLAATARAQPDWAIGPRLRRLSLADRLDLKPDEDLRETMRPALEPVAKRDQDVVE